MIVRLCHRVSESQIALHARAGCSRFEDLQDDLRVATGCGACLDCAHSTFDLARAGCSGACTAAAAVRGSAALQLAC